MSEKPADTEKKDSAKFAEAAQEAQPGFFSEFLYFLLHNKKWWITPIVIILALVGTLAILSSSPLAPFIYPLF